MKNQSKRKKIKESRQTGSVPKEWLYLNQEEVAPRGIAQIFDGRSGICAQLWEEAKVVEIELPEAGSVDIEWLKLPTGEADFDEYLQTRQVRSVFLVTLVPEDYEKAELVMKQITASLGGYFCGDNESFTPVVR